MASHVVVIDTSARRHIIKTTPGKYLSDVLQEACAKFGLKPDQYGLKHNNKPIDLSRTIRLSGLSSGAKLDLVQSSRSPSVVSVALQLPPTTVGGDSARVTDKFPSNTPIWQILRRFEAGAAGSEKANHNFTQRATPQMSNGTTAGAGRLCYEMPVVNVMGRELASFVDLQKTLGQLGYNSGSCLLRLGYRATDQPLEEAMTEISTYFKSVEEPVGGDSKGTLGVDDGTSKSKAEVKDDIQSHGLAGASIGSPDTPVEEEEIVKSPNVAESTPTPGLVIYAPPSSTSPIAASQMNYDESDYIPTIDHATKHQARLVQESRNKRLLSDAEIEAQQQAKNAALSEIKEVVIRIRFPDQSQAQQVFGRDATVNTLYERCKEMMHRPNGETFSLRVAGGKTGTSLLKEGTQRLIVDLGWQGRVLVTVLWGDDVSGDVRKGPSLKEEYRAKAESLKVELPKEVVEVEEASSSKQIEQGKEKEKGKGGDKEAKMMKFLKGLSKK